MRLIKCFENSLLHESSRCRLAGSNWRSWISPITKQVSSLRHYKKRRAKDELSSERLDGFSESKQDGSKKRNDRSLTCGGAVKSRRHDPDARIVRGDLA